MGPPGKDVSWTKPPARRSNNRTPGPCAVCGRKAPARMGGCRRPSRTPREHRATTQRGHRTIFSLMQAHRRCTGGGTWTVFGLPPAAAQMWITRYGDRERSSRPAPPFAGYIDTTYRKFAKGGASRVSLDSACLECVLERCVTLGTIGRSRSASWQRAAEVTRRTSPPQ